jgi:hypothetical protein
VAKRKNSEDKEIRLRKYIQRIEAAEKWRDNAYKDKWERYYKRYRNYVDQLIDPRTRKPVSDRSNISVPYAFVQVETVLPRLVETLFAARPYVTVKGRTSDWANNATAMQTMLDYQQNEVMDIQDLFHGGLKTMAIYGTTVAYVGWKYQERDIVRKVPKPVMVDDGTGVMVPILDELDQPVIDIQPTETTDIEYDDPEVKFIDLGNFYVDSNAEDIEDAGFCGYRCYMSKAQLQELEDQGFIDKIDWKKVPKDRKQNQARNDRMAQVGLQAPDDDSIQEEDDGLFEVHHHYEDDDKCVVIINRAYLARDGVNPFWHKKKPFVKDTYTKVPGEFYGIGLIEIIEDQVDELNTERNMRIDYRAHNLRRMFMIRKGAEIDKKQLVWKQNGIIEAQNLETDVKILNAPQIHGDTFNQEEIVKADIRDATGAHDVVMGTSSTGETATTTMSKDNNASMRFKLIISSAEKKLLVGISRFMIQNNQQFITGERILPLFDANKGDEWPVVTPEEIQGEFHLVASGSSVEPMANKEAFKQRMVELYSIAANDPLLANAPIQRRNLLKKVFEAFDITDTDDLLPSDEELMGMVNDQAIQGFIASLPPELQQILMQFMPQAPPQTAPEPVQIGGGANTAPMTERGLQVV